MRLAISGSSGLVGTALGTALSTDGVTVEPIRRNPTGPILDAVHLRACDGIVHLAGAGIADRRWTAARRRELATSRIGPTAALAALLAADPGRVRVLVVASATGWYGDRGDEELTETSALGAGFLAELCRDWEAAADPCRSRVRVVHLRLGMVLTPAGGALARMLPSARLGMAGRLGSGRQWWPWIALPDAVAAIRHALVADLAGPVNVVAPEPVRQGDFARALAAACSRPAWGPPAPAWALRLALGGLADGLLLASARVRPARLAGSGFAWTRPDLGQALRLVSGANQPLPAAR